VSFRTEEKESIFHRMREPVDRFISDLSSVCRFVCGLISAKLDLASSGHEGLIYGSSHSKDPPAKPGALRLLAPQKGLIATGKEQENLKPVDRTRIALLPRHESMIEMQIPENVKLWESPGRAGALPNC